MKKGWMASLLLISLFLLGACGGESELFKKSVEQGKLALANEEYEKALHAFELALSEKEDEEIEELVAKIKQWLQAKQFATEGKYAEAEPLLEQLLQSEQYGFGSEVSELKEKVTQYIERTVQYVTLRDEFQEEVTEERIQQFKQWMEEDTEVPKSEEWQAAIDAIQVQVEEHETAQRLAAEAAEKERAEKERLEKEKAAQKAKKPRKQSLSGRVAQAQELLHHERGHLNIRTERVPHQDIVTPAGDEVIYYAFYLYNFDTDQLIGLFYADEYESLTEADVQFAG